MIPSYHGDGLEEADSLDDLVRGGAVTDQIAKKEIVVDLVFLGEFEESQEGLHVSMNVCKNEISHG